MALPIHSASQPNLDQLLASIPSRVRGVGGAVAVVHDNGKLLSQRAWGFADLERGIRMTTKSILPICSISKHMLCLVIADLEKKPTDMMKAAGTTDVWKALDEEMRGMMPQLFQKGVGGAGERDLTVQNLFNMQSGIRDYWAMTVLWGARAEDPFSLLHDAPRTLERTRSFHFEPGTEFSYSNVNFHVLGKIVENFAGHSLGQLLAERVFIPAGMKTAALSPNCRSLPLPVVGYEGSEKGGYVPADNGIEWQGDAGITASLEDMIAYEKYFQASWMDESSNYRAIAPEAKFNDGSRASYSHAHWWAERV
jgi:CubicO group peptidase (beta-lactamase class C family)